MKNAALVFLLIALPFFTFAQHKISGKVSDAQTGKPLAFVNIIYNSERQGVISTIDGKFEINSPDSIRFLRFSYVGYKPKTIYISQAAAKNFYQIKLRQQTVGLNEITIVAGENPAHRIIRKVVENRKNNNPESLDAFSYRSYNKMVFTFDEKQVEQIDSLLEQAPDTAASDSGYLRMKKFFDSQHLFLTESVSERKYLKPGKNREEIIASRVSGFQSAPLIMLATQFQSFSFYDDLIMITDKKYLNPVSKGSTRNYFFNLRDTLFSETNDTIFVISFRPKKGKIFDAMKGVLNINTNGYAVQTVIAEPVAEQPGFSVKIQQKYQLIENKQWFPVQLNTHLRFNDENFQLVSGKHVLRMLAVGKTYISDIKINPELEKRDFSRIEIQVIEGADQKDSADWQKLRHIPLNPRDKKTYHVIDSVGKAANLDAKFQIIEALASGFLPYKFINLDLSKILNYNEFEGFKAGLGIETNQKLSRFFAVGGYLSYGFKDQRLKYGAHAKIHLHKPSETSIYATYANDATEAAGYQFLNDRDFRSTEGYRDWLVKNMDYTESYEAGLNFRLLQYFQMQAFARHKHKTATGGYQFFDPAESLDFRQKFTFSEAGLRMRFAFREKFFNTPGGTPVSLGTDYPVLYANFTQGLPAYGGEFEYQKLEAKLAQSIQFKRIGKTTLNIVAGKIWGDLPYGELYNGHGSHYPFTVETAASFGTMRLNEFVSDRFVALFFRHDFGRFLPTEKFRPRLVLVSNAGFGWLSRPMRHFQIPVKSMEKGFFESGLLIQNMFTQFDIFGYGLGVLYRYGAYRFADPFDNFSIKITLTIGL